MRPRHAAMGAGVMLAIAAGGPAAAATTTKVVPRFHIEERVRTATVDGRRALVVRELSINNLHGRLRVACNRCRRFKGQIRRTTGAHSLKITGANWIITSNRSVFVSVTRKGMLGRFVRLGVKASQLHRLVVKESGCMTSSRHVHACPQSKAPGVPPQPQPPDTTPPDTTFQSGPTGDAQGGSATFSYTSTEPGTRFDCQLDNGAWQSCDDGSSTPSFGLGGHTLLVRAVDAAGNVDPTPARRSWTRMPDNGTEYLADDQDAGFSPVGSYFTRFDGGRAVNGSYLYFQDYLACTNDQYRNQASWTIGGLPNGVYDVYADVPSNTSALGGVPDNALASGTHYEIASRESVAQVRANQSGASGSWILLAHLTFNGASTVTLYDDDIPLTCSRTYIIADAIKWIYRFPG